MQGVLTGRLRFLVAVSVVLSLGCLGATRYRPHKGYKGGYAEVRLNENTYKVSFAANGFTARTTAEAYLMYRCAELTVQSGYDHFEILEANGGWTPWNPESRRGAAAPDSDAWVSAGLREHERHHAPAYGAVIRTIKGEAQPGSYDAHQLVRYLAPSIRK